MWKVLAMFNEITDDDENLEEETIVKEKTFNTYWEARDYVFTCESQGAVGGLVMWKGHLDTDWRYYMDIQ